jgi:hypothetical protein
MFRKELRDIFKPTLVRLSFLLSVPLLALFKVSLWKIYHFLMISVFRILNAYVDNIYVNSFIFLLGMVILWTANHYGTHAFGTEHRDRAFEYVLAFPFSRYRILMYKLVPRGLLLLGLTVVYEVLALVYAAPLEVIQGPLYFLMDPVFFPFWVVFLFLVGFFLGLFEQKGWIAVVTLITFFSAVLFSVGVCRPVIRVVGPGVFEGSFLTGMGFLFGVLIVVLVLGIGFFRVYRRFDLKSPALYAKRFAFFVLPPLVLLTIISVYLLIAG